jgi:two-component system response regulator NreC
MAIRAAAAGQTYLSPAVAGDLVRDFVTHCRGGGLDEPKLSRREYEVLQLIAEGLGTGQVGARLSISPKTVNTHREHIMAKLDLHTDVALCRYAMRHGMVSD